MACVLGLSRSLNPHLLNFPHFSRLTIEYLCLKDVKLVERYPIELCSVKVIEGNLLGYCFELYCSNNVRKLYRTYDKDDQDEWLSTLRRLIELILKRSSNIEIPGSSDNDHDYKECADTRENLLHAIQEVDPENKCKRNSPSSALNQNK